MAEKKDYYAILGVEKTANDDELKNLEGILEAISGSSRPNPRL